MARAKPSRKTHRGNIEQLPSGAVRVRVYAGIDPVTGRQHYLKRVVPAGPNALGEAEEVRTNFLSQVDEGRNPRTRATVNQLMDRYLELLNVGTTTKAGYEGYIRTHVRPLLGTMQVSRLDGEILDSFYHTLRSCRVHCQGVKHIDHRTSKPHECDDRCKPHECKGLSKSSIRQIHWCLSGAIKSAIRWRWITVNPLDQTKVPQAATPNPQPPSPEQAATIVNEAFRDFPWGVMVWLATTTGTRRGELCALRLDQLDLEHGVLTIRSSIGQHGAETWEKDTKTHQQRRIALDTETVALLRTYVQQRAAEAQKLGVTLRPDGRLFSPDVDHSGWIKPSTVSQRYRRMCAKLGWRMHIHQLRHYSATELISAGVDARTVAGRLGHGGGGSTTLRVYSAWVAEADQRAAKSLSGRMPTAPVSISDDGTATTVREPEDTSSPYQDIAADLRGAISSGVLQPGDKLPTVAALADRYEVSFGTAQRAVAELRSESRVAVSRGRRAVVADPRAHSEKLAEVGILRRPDTAS